MEAAAEVDLDATLTWYGELAPGEKQFLSSSMSRAVEIELAQNPKAFLEKVDANNLLDQLAPVFQSVGFSNTSQWRDIADWLKDQPELPVQLALSTPLASALVNEDPSAAIEYVNGVTSTQLKFDLQKKVAAGLIDTPSLEAVSYYRSRHPEWSRSLTLAAFEKLGEESNVTRLPQFPSELDSWKSAADQLNNDDLATVAPRFARALFEQDPAEALGWFEALPEDRLPRKYKTHAFTNSLYQWMWQNESPALDWISQNDLGGFQDQANGVVVGHLSGRNASFDDVWPWFEALSGAEGRKAAFHSLQRAYKSAHQEELSARIEALPIPADERAYYLEQLDKPTP